MRDMRWCPSRGMPPSSPVASFPLRYVFGADSARKHPFRYEQGEEERAPTTKVASSSSPSSSPSWLQSRTLKVRYTVSEELSEWHFFRAGSAGRTLLTFLESCYSGDDGICVLHISLYGGCTEHARLLRQFGLQAKCSGPGRLGKAHYVVEGLQGVCPMVTVWRSRAVINVLLAGLFHPREKGLLHDLPVDVFREKIWIDVCEDLGVNPGGDPDNGKVYTPRRWRRTACENESDDDTSMLSADFSSIASEYEELHIEILEDEHGIHDNGNLDAQNNGNNVPQGLAHMAMVE